MRGFDNGLELDHFIYKGGIIERQVATEFGKDTDGFFASVVGHEPSVDHQSDDVVKDAGRLLAYRGDSGRKKTVNEHIRTGMIMNPSGNRHL